MSFHTKRRQQFLGQAHYESELSALAQGIELFRSKPAGSGDTEIEGWMISWRSIARYQLQRVCLRYTAGEPVQAFRQDFEQVVSSFENFGDWLWRSSGDRNEPVFQYDVLDEYCQLMQLIGLCFLLHRRDLLPRIAALQDGESGKGNGGRDTLYEEFMAFGLGPETRFETDALCQVRPYEDLFNGLTETTPGRALTEIDRFLKHWYKDLAGTGWHDSHKPDEKGCQSGYFGYWSFEAGAAVLLLGIEDDSRLHKYLYYPKDLVAWAREHAWLSAADERAAARLRAAAGEPCPRDGYWMTPAGTSTRRRFARGETMPEVGCDYGTTLWQWDDNQAP
ncbi:hypothetical protein CKO44_10480 [Rubrivivax gelatinosus]|uniref:PoNi C-terminal domain-containing protein n=1 Tax=Rubrivivax gelatinosus TaxID=28068 RepID=A0ABS1DWH5_RUBGE|nr:PoNe immunity protein domain-containing protein [Rubrivivax gelatinosus]MBK1613895.1 hypothetical protein [Rubrivivax gelatinosus]MBK1714342.1 hypothetical protein [Rubrivivax gelatinosus]MBZ8143489.1 hypothetical protein [Rubrivivax gelatinosus]